MMRYGQHGKVPAALKPQIATIHRGQPNKETGLSFILKNVPKNIYVKPAKA